MGSVTCYYCYVKYSFYLYVDTFHGLPYLKKLRLNRNHLTNIAPQTFVNLGLLQDLDLEANKIEAIHAETLKGNLTLPHIATTYLIYAQLHMY